jgi:hypothetical protein
LKAYFIKYTFLWRFLKFLKKKKEEEEERKKERKKEEEINF